MCPSTFRNVYFLWGYDKSQVYQKRPKILEDLKNNIRRVMAEILTEMCQRTMRLLLQRLQICIDRS